MWRWTFTTCGGELSWHVKMGLSTCDGPSMTCDGGPLMTCGDRPLMACGGGLLQHVEVVFYDMWR